MMEGAPYPAGVECISAMNHIVRNTDKVSKGCLTGSVDTERRWLPHTPAPRQVAFVLAMIFVVAVTLRLISFHGYAGSDDGSYAELAQALATGNFRVGEYVGPPVFPLRVGVFGPVAALFRLFGPGEWTTMAYPFLLSLGMVGLAFVAGRLLFGTTAGLLAAAVQAIIPLASRSATILMPDLPAAFWANVGVVALLFGLRREGVRAKALLGVACGLALGLSWLCKETVAYFAPFLIGATIYMTWRSRIQLPLAVASVGALAGVVVVETLVYWRLTGDPFHRVHEMHRNYEYNSTWFFTEGSRFGWAPGEYHIALVKRLFRDGPLTLLASPSFGGVTAVAVLAVAYASFRKQRAFAFVAAWFIWLLLAFNFGTSSLRQYQPLVLFDKYAYPLLFPSCLLTAGFLSQLLAGQPIWRRPAEPAASERAFWGYAVSALLVSGSLVVTAENVWSGRKSAAERIAARSLSPRDPLYTDSRTLRVMEFFWSFPKQLAGVDFSNLTADDIPPGAYVLVNRSKLRLLENYYEYGVPTFCREPPAEWTVVSQGDGIVLYRKPIDDLVKAPAATTSGPARR